MVKNFTQYLLESEEKTYEFKIKICNIEVDNDVQDKIEHALGAFEVASISKAKRLPIADKHLDFPSFEKCEVYLINVALKYPCTDEQIRQVLGSHGRLPLANVVVVPKNSPEELLRDEAEDETTSTKDKKSKLETEMENVSGGQVQVGQKRIDTMLKELEKDRQELEFEKKEKVDSKTTNDLPQNDKSPVAKGK